MIHKGFLSVSQVYQLFSDVSNVYKSVRKMLEKTLHQKKETAEKSAFFLYAWQKVKWVQGAEGQCVAETIPLYSAAIMNAP